MSYAMKKNIFLTAALIMSAVVVQGQCFPDRHSTNFYDGWISCEAAENPNPARGISHFILYDFGKLYELGQMRIWNTNDPSHLDWGMRDVAIDYSTDGETWLTAGDFTFPQAPGLSTYEGEQGPHLNAIQARYLLITGLNNYGGECYGISEVKIDAEEVIISDVEEPAVLACVGVSVYPNPFAEKVTLALTPGCSGDIRYSLYDQEGRMILSQSASLVQGQNKSFDLGRDLPSGAYTLRVSFGDKVVQRTLVKVERS